MSNENGKHSNKNSTNAKQTSPVKEIRQRLKTSPELRRVLRKGKLRLRSATNVGRVFVGSRAAKSFPHWKDYLKKQPVAGYIGWLGYANLGDEAMYVAFQRLFAPYNVILANDTHPIELKIHRSLGKGRKFYDFVFLGGGTLINAPRYLKAIKHTIVRQRKLIVFGTGVLDPSFWASHRSDLDYGQVRAEWGKMLGHAEFLSVRGPQSAAILESYGLPRPRVIGDPALFICDPRPATAPRSNTIALNLGCSGPMWGQQENLIAEMGKLAQHLLQTGKQVEFIPMHGSDLKLGERLIRDYKLSGATIWREFEQVEKTITHIKSYDLVIGQRLHAAILAAGSGVPTISLAYRPKCEDFMESIELSDFALRTDRASVDNILSLMTDIENTYEAHCQHLNQHCDRFREMQYQAALDVLYLVNPELTRPDSNICKQQKASITNVEQK